MTSEGTSPARQWNGKLPVDQAFTEGLLTRPVKVAAILAPFDPASHRLQLVVGKLVACLLYEPKHLVGGLGGP